MKKYEHINAPYSFKEFYSKYPQGYTIYEALLDWLNHVNSMTDVLNITIERYAQIEKLIHDELSEIADAQLNTWLDDGTLQNLINQTLFQELNDEITGLDNRLTIISGVVRSIEEYPRLNNENNDSPRIQRAINELHTSGGGTITFPEKVFLISQTLIVYGQINLKGNGIGSTVFKVNGDREFMKSATPNVRMDNFEISNCTIQRNGLNITKPLIDAGGLAYSRFTNLSCLSFDNQHTNVGNIGIVFKTWSYYNFIQNCQFRDFHIGMAFINEANGNNVYGGSCIRCAENGVLIDKTNSTKFFGHAVELGTNIAYKVVNKSHYNNFFGCRIEGASKGYYIPFEENGNSSLSNLVFGGLGYNITGQYFDSSEVRNFNLDYLGIVRLLYKQNFPSFKVASNESQTAIPGGASQRLLFGSKWYERGEGLLVPTDGRTQFVAPMEGLYVFEISVLMETTQTNGVTLSLRVNSASVFDDNMTVSGQSYRTRTSVWLKPGDLVFPVIKPSVTSRVLSGGNATYFVGYAI